jgi:YidC/Oxa1 family membrane protein insertase
VDKKNLIAFLSLSLAVLLLSQVLFPQPQPPEAKPGQRPAAQAGADADRPGIAADKAKSAVEGERAPAAAQDDAAVADIPEAAEIPLEYLSLGSLDRESGYRMLVTFTNEGGAVRRAELSSERFLDLTDRSGYLGQLELEQTGDGLKVQVVGQGTPAEEAGLKVGDVIVGIQRANSEMVAVTTMKKFESVRSKSLPGQELTLSVIRDGGPAVDMIVKMVRRPLAVLRPEIENIEMRHGAVPDGFTDPPSFLSSLASVGEQQYPADAAAQLEAWLDEGNSAQAPKSRTLKTAINLDRRLTEGTWTIAAHDDTSVTFEQSLPGQKLKFIKRYSLEPAPAGSISDKDYPAYNLKLDIAIENTGDANQAVAYRLDGPTGLPLEGWWYTHKISRSWSGAGLRDVVVRFFGSATTQFNCSAIAEDDTEPMGGEGTSLAFVGVDAVYFSAIMIPVKQSLEEDWFDSTEAIRLWPKPNVSVTPLRFTNVSCRMTRKPVVLAPGQKQEDSYVVFIGPKRPELLAQYQAASDPNYSLRDIIYYGMWPFGAVARGMLSVLHLFYSYVGNFGIAIIMLTVMVRGAMFPISFKQTKSMARMQALKPELDRINEKYKTDMQKRSQAMQELYRKNKINPLGGCLPVFLQLPIFMGLYRSIMIDVELRQRPLFTEAIRWCSDLSAPDMLYSWSWLMPEWVNNGEGIFVLGPFFNVFPLVTVVMFLMSMKMSMPEPTNEQAAMQQKMMKYMTLFMGLMFYKVACGLCLYFIASSLWGIGERKLLNKSKQTEIDNASGDGGQSARKLSPPPRGPSGGGSNGANGSEGRKKGAKAKRKR